MLVYTSAPYGNAKDPEQRMEEISSYSADLMKQGTHVICPMTLGIQLAKKAELPRVREWWMEWCLKLLSKCDEMHVLCLEGWLESPGVQEEISFARDHNITIKYITLN